MTVAEPAARLDALVRENLDLVYASALRQVKDPHLAADVTQAVFLILQHKLPDLDQRTIFAAWLLRVTRYACMDAAKRSRRRTFHEKKAAAMRSEKAPEHADISPLIDEALDRLSEADREVIVLAYLQGHPHEEVASRLGIGREAAHKRVQRAVERLRKILLKQGMPAMGITPGLAGIGKPALAPAAVSQAVFTSVAGHAPALAQIIAKGTMIMMKLMKAKTGLLTVAVAGVVLATVTFFPAWGQSGNIPGAQAASAPNTPIEAAASPPADNGAFLPERTLVIFDDGVGHDLVADLDAGKTFTPPSDADVGAFGMITWIANQGGDLIYESAPGTQAMIGLDMGICPAQGQYDLLDAGMIMQMLIPSTVTTPAIMSARGLPSSFAFRTREGGVGVLQLEKVDDQQSSITVRYRMLAAGARDRAAFNVVEASVLPEMGKLCAKLNAATSAEEITIAARGLDRASQALGSTLHGTSVNPSTWRLLGTATRIMAELIDDKKIEKAKEKGADVQQALDGLKAEISRAKAAAG